MNQIDFSALSGTVAVLAFGVNLIVQLTKEHVELPTKLWTLIVSATLCIVCLFTGIHSGKIGADLTSGALALAGSFVVAYVAMYGFDTFSDLWKRFLKGENINENN